MVIYGLVSSNCMNGDVTLLKQQKKVKRNSLISYLKGSHFPGNSSPLSITHVHTKSLLYITGFTPMVKVLRDALSSQLASREQALASNSNSNGSCSSSSSSQSREQSAATKTAKLLFANKAEKDILWREELDQFSKTTQGR